MPTIVPAASRTMALLEVFARERRELSNSDLARLMDLPESSCSDLLHTLHELGYLMRTARTRRFYPTARLLTVAKGIAAGDSLYAVASEACELLRDKTGETGMCGRVEAGVVKVLAFAEGTHPLRYVENVGNKIALHVSALGKATLSLGTPEEAARQLRLKPLKQIAPGSITDLAALEAQIAQAREQGWMWVENEGFDGLAAIAVAGYLGDEPLALSIAGPTERLRRTKDACLQALQEVQALVFHPLNAAPTLRATASGRRGAGTKDTTPA